MASSLKLKNANGKTLAINNSDSNTEDIVINGGKITTYVDTVEDLASIGSEIGTVIVSDKDRGGIFNAITSELANDGTIFNGSGCSWERQYSGAVNVKWFGAKGDGATDDTVAIQSAIDYASITSKSLYIKTGVYSIGSKITLSCSLLGDNCNTSIFKHDGASKITMFEQTGTGRETNIFDIGFWGAGQDGDGNWLTDVLLKLTSTTRGLEINRCEFGNYGTPNYGAEYGMYISGYAYYKAIINCVFDYNNIALYTENNGNSIGRQLVDCRFEHSLGYTAIALGSSSAIDLHDCAIQFNQGAGICTVPDSIDTVNKILSGNTSSGSVEVHGSTFEQNNRDLWSYTLDSVDTLIGYISILKGSASINDCFITALSGENGQGVLGDEASLSIDGIRTTASAILNLLYAGNNIVEPIKFFNYSIKSQASTNPYTLNDTSKELWLAENEYRRDSAFDAPYSKGNNDTKILSYSDTNLEDNTLTTIRVDVPSSGTFTLDCISRTTSYGPSGGLMTNFKVRLCYGSGYTLATNEVIYTNGNPVTIDTSNITTVGGYALITFTSTGSSVGTSTNNTHDINIEGNFEAVSIYQ